MTDDERNAAGSYQNYAYSDEHYANLPVRSSSSALQHSNPLSVNLEPEDQIEDNASSADATPLAADFTRSSAPYSSIDALLADRNVSHPTSNLDTLMHILKGNIGTGILAIPDALKNSGLTLGTCGLVFISVICIHCMHLLLKCSRHLCMRTGTPSLDFATTSEVAFATGPVKLRKFAGTFRFLTNFFLCVVQLGFCCVYLVFVSNNVKQIVDVEDGPNLNYRIYVAMLLIPVILINLLRNLKFLVPASIVANVLQVVSLGIIFYYICQNIPPISSRKQVASLGQIPLFFGTVVYAFEGIGLVLPLEINMSTPAAFGGIAGVLNTAMVIVACFYTSVGFYGYLKYGDDVLGSITLNLPKTDVLADVVRAFYAFAIFLSYAIQFYVPIQIMWPFIERRISPRYHYPAEIAFRVLIIFITFSLAVLIPQLNLFISLVGAFSGSYLSLIIPPILEIVTFWSEGISGYVVFKDMAIAFIGIVGFLTGSYVSIYNIITTFGD